MDIRERLVEKCFHSLFAVFMPPVTLLHTTNKIKTYVNAFNFFTPWSRITCTPMTEAVYSTKTIVPMYQTTRCHISESHKTQTRTWQHISQQVPYQERLACLHGTSPLTLCHHPPRALIRQPRPLAPHARRLSQYGRIRGKLPGV